jgi:hypothetical protein
MNRLTHHGVREAMVKRLIVATVVAITIACGSSSLVGPGTNTIKPLQSLSLTVGGTSTASSNVTLAPGSVTPLRLVATFTDHSTEDVASRATWTATNPDVLRVDGSQAVAIQDGDAGITGLFSGMSSRLAVTVIETGTVIVQGSVVDSGFPLPGARVEVLSGTGAGKATTTDAKGNYKLWGVVGSIQMRASLDGYVSQTVGVTVASTSGTSGPTLNFTLTPTATPVDVSGNWDLTVDASPSCTTLPDVAHRRTYTAAIDETGSSLKVTLSGAQFAKDLGYYSNPGALENQFRAHLVGNAMALALITSTSFYYKIMHYDFAEIISANTQFVIVGTGTGTATSSTISVTLDGYFALLTIGSAASVSTCTAADHRFTFVRHSATSGRRR